MLNEVRLSELCNRVLAITPRRYQQLAREGVLPVGEHGRVDAILACAKFIAYQKKQIAGSGSLTLAEERTRKVRIDADMAEMEFAKIQGRVKETNKIVQDLSILFSNVKLHLMAWSKSLPPILIGKDEKEMGVQIRKETELVLNEFASGIGIITGRTESDQR